MPRSRWPRYAFRTLTCVLPALCLAAVAGASPPDEGTGDTGGSLMDGKGFLPVPIIISEPAVGMGLGLAVGFIHQSKGDPGDRPARPSISGAVGVYTGNGSWVAGGGHSGSWKQDTIRYTGAAGFAALNLDFFVNDEPFGYSMDGTFLFQEIQFRLGESNFFLGGRLTYFDSDAEFDAVDMIPGVEPEALSSTNVSLGGVLHYDSTDNPFTPGRGQAGWLIYSLFEPWLGSDFDYEQLEAKIFSYHPLHDRFVLGLRLDFKVVHGRAPFYGLPFVELRGIPLGRYQDEQAGVAELEGRWNLTGRWSLVGFGGAGHLDGDIPRLSNKETVWAGGVGFRYLLAQQLGLHVGIDLAQGPEDTVVYIQVGSAWR